jgi:tripartite ATP-independent transporter DctM subunit
VSPELIGLSGFSALIVLVLARMPIGPAMGIVGGFGYAAIDGWKRALLVVGSTPLELSNYSLSVLPLFILVGAVATVSGMSQELFTASNSLFTRQRGALAMATIGGCAGFSAISGSSLATSAAFARIAIPEMLRHGYDKRLATGSVAVGGTLGILIPPSLILVIYGIYAQQSIPALFAAGLIPGLMLAALFVGVVWVIVRIRPEWAPLGEPLPWRQRFGAVLKMWKLALLFGLAVGGIYSGIFSPTQAAGVTAFCAFIIAAAAHRLNLKTFVQCLLETVRTTAMLFLILVGAWIFAYFIGQTRLPQALVGFVQHLGPSAFTVILMILLFYIILGCVMESVAIIVITTPVFLPLVIQIGFDPVWYGVLMVLVVEIGLITPPVGLNLFVIRSQLPDVPLATIIRGAFPFLAADFILVLLLLLFPPIALWLPKVLY